MSEKNERVYKDGHEVVSDTRTILQRLSSGRYGLARFASDGGLGFSGKDGGGLWGWVDEDALAAIQAAGYLSGERVTDLGLAFLARRALTPRLAAALRADAEAPDPEGCSWEEFADQLLAHALPDPVRQQAPTEAA